MGRVLIIFPKKDRNLIRNSKKFERLGLLKTSTRSDYHPIFYFYSHIAQDLKIRAGEWDTQTTTEELPFQERDVVEIVKHPDFSDKTLAYDFALLLLDSPVQLDRHISTICLADQDQIFTQRNCFASGWGKKEFGANNLYQVILKKIELPIVDKAQCQEDLRQTRLKQKFRLHPSFTCAGGESGKDTCRVS